MSEYWQCMECGALDLRGERCVFCGERKMEPVSVVPRGEVERSAQDAWRECVSHVLAEAQVVYDGMTGDRLFRLTDEAMKRIAAAKLVNPPEARTCATCRWWRRFQDGGLVGYCNNMDVRSMIAVGGPIDPFKIATPSDFACNRHEAREEARHG